MFIIGIFYFNWLQNFCYLSTQNESKITYNLYAKEPGKYKSCQ